MDGEGGPAGHVHGARLMGSVGFSSSWRLARNAVVALAAMLLAAATPLLAQPQDAFAGVWRLSVEKSVYEAGRPPKSYTRTYEDRGGGTLFLTVDSVNAAGVSTRLYLVYKRDGKPYPESAAGLKQVRMVAVRAVDASTEEVGTVVNGLVTEIGNTLTVSRDKKTLTQTLKGVTPDGRPYTNVVVYDRQ